MRVLVIGINYAPDLIGVAKYNTEFCENLASWGHEVRVVTAPPYYPDWSIPPGYRSRWYRHQRLNDVDVHSGADLRAKPALGSQATASPRLLHAFGGRPRSVERALVAPRYRLRGGAIPAFRAHGGIGRQDDRRILLGSMFETSKSTQPSRSGCSAAASRAS